MIDKIFDLIKSAGGRVDFKTSLTIRMSPHTYPIKIKSVSTNGFDVIYTDKEGNNRILLDTNKEAKGSIYQRLAIMKKDGEI